MLWVANTIDFRAQERCTVRVCVPLPSTPYKKMQCSPYFCQLKIWCARMMCNLHNFRRKGPLIQWGNLQLNRNKTHYTFRAEICNVFRMGIVFIIDLFSEKMGRGNKLSRRTHHRGFEKKCICSFIYFAMYFVLFLCHE